ncbi:glycosyltransferase family 4 protein [bacterium]|nr:glycosyltransferase family 4 protein [bacterium]
MASIAEARRRCYHNYMEKKPEQIEGGKERKKKLLYCITKSNWGGAQRYVYELAGHFAQTGEYDVAVALGGEGVLKERLEEAGIRVILISGLKRDMGVNETAVFWRLYKIFKQEKPDIVHVNSSKIGGMGALAARIARVPRIIFTAHGWAFREERSEIQKFFIKLASWLTIFFSHKTICVSEYDAKQAQDFPFAKEKIITIRNGIGTPEFLSRQEARESLVSASPLLRQLADSHSKEVKKEHRRPLWMGTIGELHKNKGHAYAIEAVKELVAQKTDVIFVIIGEGEEHEYLEKLTKKYGLEKHIFLLGNKENAGAILKAFDLFLFPSVKEGMPYAVIEAGFAGLPVVASSVGGIPEIITDMESGILVRPKDAGEIVRAVNFFFDHPGSAEKFGKKLAAKVAKSFSFQKMAKETEKVYRSA